MSDKILKNVEDYIINFYATKSPKHNYYHSITHIKFVVNKVLEIGRNEDISEEDLEILQIAAWFHDVGHIESWEGHENVSINHAKNFLQELNYPENKISKVSQCISATQLPSKPKDILEEIICDADIAHIGSEEFLDFSELLKLEIEKRNKTKIKKTEWLKKNIEFVSNHTFFTKYAKTRFEDMRNKNLLMLERMLEKKKESKKRSKQKEKKLNLEKKKLNQKQLNSKKSDRGIETMFRNVIRTHVSFSSMADSKANIMISVNTLLLGAIFTILTRKLDTNPHLIIPTVVLTIVSLVTLILAVMVTRPKVSSGTFTKEDIQSKDTNLLFFGNFYKMKLKDFTWGMQEMMEDKDFLYGSMIKDFYYLGQVLGTKYKLLRICYTIFMYGIVLSAILFGIYVWMNPGGSNINGLID